MDAEDKTTSGASGAPPGPPGCDVRWPYSADPPQRLGGNFGRYLAGGGLVRPHEDVRGFVSAEPGNAGDMGRFYFFCMVLDQMAKEEIGGDLLEIGVYKGSTAAILATMARKLGRTLFLLDTFEGFAATDLQGIDADKRMNFADTSVEAVRSLVGETNVRIVKGYFPATATQLPPEGRYGLVHIDCDLYAPIKSALDYFYPRMVPGGFMIVHDYSSLHWNGAEHAVDEFFLDKPEWVVPLTDQSGSVVVRKAGVRAVSGGARTTQPPPRMAPVGAIVGPDWVATANGALAGVLGHGWSEPEPWGIWGVGETHELVLQITNTSASALALDADVHVPLLGLRTSQLVDVFVEAHKVATWNFTIDTNRAVRSARIPHEIVASAQVEAGLRTLRISFRPYSVALPRDLDPSLDESRPLGMALHRIRASVL